MIRKMSWTHEYHDFTMEPSAIRLRQPVEAHREYAMNASANIDGIKTITTHYIDGAFVPSHGSEVMDVIRPTDARMIA